MSEANKNQPSKLEKDVVVETDISLMQQLGPNPDEKLNNLMEEHREFFDREIPWRDFYSNFLEFDRIRQRNPDVRDAKTEYVEFEIAPLQAYLKKLTEQGFGYVDVYIGKYRDGDHQQHSRDRCFGANLRTRRSSRGPRIFDSTARGAS